MEQFEELNLRRLAEIIFKHIGMIIAVTLIAGILAFVYSETMIVPEYESAVSVYVNNEKSGESNKILSSDITASQMLVDTYVVIVKSDTVLNQVSDRLNDEGITGYNANVLRTKITASSVDQTEIFQINVRDTDPENTYMIANIIAEICPEVIKDFVEASSVKVIDYAVMGVRVAPNIQNNMLLGLALGLFLSCAFVVLREIFDMRIKTEDELEQWFKLPILGVVPDITSSQQVKRSGYYSYQAYRRSSGEHEKKKEEKGNGGKSRKSKKDN